MGPQTATTNITAGETFQDPWSVPERLGALTRNDAGTKTDTSADTTASANTGTNKTQMSCQVLCLWHLPSIIDPARSGFKMLKGRNRLHLFA